MRRMFLAAAFSLLGSQAFAGTSAGYGQGGQFSRFDPVVAQYNASGEEMRIVGHCQSACTIFLAIRNVCVDPNARLLFHAGHDRQRNISERWTQHMLNHYNAALRNYLVAGGYMRTLAFHTISGRDIINKFGYRACK